VHLLWSVRARHSVARGDKPSYQATDYAVYRLTLVTWGSYTQADDVLPTRPNRAQTTKSNYHQHQLTALRILQILIHSGTGASQIGPKPTKTTWAGRDCNMPEGGMRHCLSCLTR
jgi:hypothetical protein